MQHRHVNNLRDAQYYYELVLERRILGLSEMDQRFMVEMKDRLCACSLARTLTRLQQERVIAIGEACRLLIMAMDG